MGLSRTGIIAAIVAGVLVVGLALWQGPWVTLAVMVTLLVIVAVLSLLVAKTDVGRRGAEAVGRRVGRTRVGKRISHAQLRSAAKRQGVAMTDPFGRPLSDVEIQLELLDTPETQAIKRQLRTMNPQQRAQALRMLQQQSEEAQRTGKAPAPVAPPRMPGVSGRPVTRPPRSRRKRKR